MLAFSALVAGSFALGSKSANLLEPAALNALRFALATALIGAVAIATGRLRRADARAPWRYLILGGLLCSYFVLMFEGLKTAPPVSAAAVFTLTPIMAGGFGYLVMRQVVTAQMALALAVGAIGALWVIFRADLTAAMAVEVGRGEVVYFWGCVAHALYAPLVPRLNRGETPVAFTFGTLLAATLVLIAVGWPALANANWSALPGIVWVTILYTAIAATAATFVLLQFASLRLPAAKVMAYTYLTPSWVILWQVALDADVPPALILVGVALSVAALLLLLRRSA
ncbi:MAG: DMT family transporter [Pseudomonadota bacterium]